jgi:hypothetical protein
MNYFRIRNSGGCNSFFSLMPDGSFFPVLQVFTVVVSVLAPASFSFDFVLKMGDILFYWRRAKLCLTCSNSFRSCCEYSDGSIFFSFWDTNENRLYLDVKTKVPEFDPQAYERLKNTFIMLDSCTNAGQQGQATALGAADVLGGTGWEKLMVYSRITHSWHSWFPHFWRIPPCNFHLQA